MEGAGDAAGDVAGFVRAQRCSAALSLSLSQPLSRPQATTSSAGSACRSTTSRRRRTRPQARTTSPSESDCGSPPVQPPLRPGLSAVVVTPERWSREIRPVGKPTGAAGARTCSPCWYVCVRCDGSLSLSGFRLARPRGGAATSQLHRPPRALASGGRVSPVNKFLMQRGQNSSCAAQRALCDERKDVQRG